MVPSPGGGPARLPPIDAETMRRLMIHEARVHGLPGRTLKDLGDAVLLHDPVDPEPFWNRVELVKWPDDPAGFDRRLTETLVLFAAMGRQPHIWASPLYDEPADLVSRLAANGFADLGLGDLMALADPDRLMAAAPGYLPAGVALERLSGLSESEAADAARDVVEVLVDAFDVEPERRAPIEAETSATLRHPWFTHYLVRLDGAPAAVARRATFDGASYLSSIGTASWARRRGLARLATVMAASDALADESDWTYLGVFSDNEAAIRLYREIGFERIGASSPDMLLV